MSRFGLRSHAGRWDRRRHPHTSGVISSARAGARQAVHLAGPGGHVVWAAVYPVGGEIPASPWLMFRNDLSIHGMFQSPYFLWRANAMLPVLDLAPIISHVYPWDKINQAFDDQINGRVMKALVKP